MKKKNLLSLAISIILILSTVIIPSEGILVKAAAEENVIDGYYIYPITPNDAEWKGFESIEEKIAACKIPEEILKSMTEEQLIRAVLDYPFIYEVFAYPTIEAGVVSLEKISDAYAELLSRYNAKEELMNAVRVKSNSMLRTASISAEEEIRNEFLAAIILCQNDFQDELTREEVEILDDFSTIMDIQMPDEKQDIIAVVAAAATYVTTPNGTKVEYISRTCSHESSNFHSKLDNDAAASYGVTVVSYGNCKYNCHSYAWYSQSTSNTKWINNPSAYMTDGSYKKVLSGNLNSYSLSVANGDIIFYGTTSNLSSAHSARVTDSASNVPIATRKVKSKWGAYGVFSHSVSRVPKDYSVSTITAWHR